MYNYTASTLAIRAKCSLSFHYLSPPYDQPFCCNHSCCHFFANPSFLSGYLLSLSSPFASKSLFRRRLRVFYRRRELDITGLLAESEERFSGLGEIQNELIGGRSSRKEGRRGICSSRSGSKISEVERRRVGGESLVGFSNSEKGVDDSVRGRRCSWTRDVDLDSREDECSRRNGSFRRLGVSEVERRRGGGESLVGFSNSEKGVDDSLRERRCSWTRDVDLDSREDECSRRNGSFRRLGVSEVERRRGGGESLVGFSNSKKGVDEKVDQRADLRSKNVRRVDEVQLEDVKRTSVLANVRKMERGENSVSAARQNSDIDHPLTDDRQRRLQKQSKIAEFHYNDAESAAYSRRDFQETSSRARGERDKRVYIERRALEQDESRRNNRSQMETELHLSLENRSEGRKDKLTMEGNSMQLRGGERKQIVRGAVELGDAQRNTQKLSEVSEVLSGKNEAYSLCSVQSSVPATKDKGTQVEMHDAYYDQIEMSRLNANNMVDSTSSWVPPVCGVDSQEYGTLLASNQVSSVRQQNDQVRKQAYLLYGAKMESETSEFDHITNNNRRISSLKDTYNSRIENEKQLSSAKTSSLALIREQEIQRSSFTGESSQSESMDVNYDFSIPQPNFSDINYDAGLIAYQKIQHDTNYSARKFDKSSASHASELVGKMQKEAVALNESGKIPNVFDGVQIGKQGRRDVHATLRIDNRNETFSTVSTQERKERQSNLLVGESSQYKTTKVASTGSIGDVFSRADTYSEMGDHSHRDDTRHITNDAIESTKRLEKSSAFHVDEFVNEMRQEILNESGKESDVSTRFQIEETDKREGQGAAGMLVVELTENREYGEGRHNKEDRRLSSSGLEMRGPSEEMWGQIESSQKTSNAEEPEENSLTSEAVDLTNPLETAVGRSPKSLWSYVADIIRMSWILRDNSHSKTSKSDKRTSSNDSISSEAWFSGRELEEDGAGDEAQNTEKTGLLKEAGLVKESVKLPLQELKKGGRLNVIEPTSSILSGFMTSGLSDRTASPSEEVEHTHDLKSGQATLSGVAIVEQQLPSKSDAALPSITDVVESRERDRVRVLKPSFSYPAAVMRVGFPSSITQSTGAEQMEAAQVDKDNNSSLENFEQPLAPTVDSALPRFNDFEEVDKHGSIPDLDLDPFSEKLPVVGGTNEGGIKQRKFQRSKQVVSEQFDEWEDAFKRENEQKKLDEFFMREAIMEAKKSADAWEVPVGAVLVQNGRIVARGCNMVEELRDSTAHAEMICIREASNVLRNWRLAETTLYVTLEPCPMCAGAILQARIDTVVWGAPNRLLGADGSWVRLFPGGDGGSSSMSPPSQMVGPVHPFHPKITIRRGILETECGEVMQQFFKLRRKKDKKPESSPPMSLPISNRPTKFFSKLHNIFGMMFCL